MRLLAAAACIVAAHATAFSDEPAFAAEASADAKTAPASQVCPICGRLRSEHLEYSDKAGTMLARGALNFALGWTEMMKQPAQEVREGHSVLTGLARGVERSTARTIGGLGELATFWLPKINGTYNTGISQDCPLDVQTPSEPKSKRAPEKPAP